MIKFDEVILEDIEDFYVTELAGRNYLYTYFDQRVAECVNGDYQSRFGGIRGWLDYINKRSERRITKIREIQSKLQDEESELEELIWRIDNTRDKE